MLTATDPNLPADLIPLQYHFVMLGDEARMGGFERAIELMIKPGMKVVDLGAGTGVLSYMAARAGAEVWAVEALPELASIAKETLQLNGVADRVHVVEKDATTFVPPQPVNAVICEMLHVGLLREKQVEVIRAFRENHRKAFGCEPTIYIPDTTFQAVQLVEHDFNYHGYLARTPVFQQADALQPRTTELGNPVVYQSISWSNDLPAECHFEGSLQATHSGVVNGLRFITKSVLAVDLALETTVDWFMQYLIVPLQNPVLIEPGSHLNVAFSYRPGDEITELQSSLSVTQ